MAIDLYLAMTAAEIGRISELPPKIGWMACHFSPYSTGISNLPESLPEGSLLILNDITPIHGHDPERIGAQLAECIESNKCMGVLLDFQHESNGELEKLAAYLTGALPCPVAYSGECKGPVFVPPVPCSIPLAEYIAQWEHKSLWLETALTAEVLSLTEQGCKTMPLSAHNLPVHGQKEETLHCHYHINLFDSEVRFTLWRTKEDLRELLEEADSLGIHTAVGLWQELG